MNYQDLQNLTVYISTRIKELEKRVEQLNTTVNLGNKHWYSEILHARIDELKALSKEFKAI